jgi:hypothetical protein
MGRLKVNAKIAILATWFCLTLMSTAIASSVTWRYPGDLNVNPISETYVNNVSLDMIGYARDFAVARGGRRDSVSIYLAQNNAFGWRMRYYVPSRNQWVTAGFDMVAVAERHGRNRFGSQRMRNWGVYVRDFNNPYSWRGAYIVRVR